MEKRAGQRGMQVVLVWHKVRCTEEGELKTYYIQALNLDAFSALLDPFFLRYYATFYKISHEQYQ